MNQCSKCKRSTACKFAKYEPELKEILCPLKETFKKVITHPASLMMMCAGGQEFFSATQYLSEQFGVALLN